MNQNTLQRTLDLALNQHRSGQHEEAARLYAQVCRAVPRLFDGWYLAGTLEVHRDRPKDAIPLLQRALRISPASSQCKLFLGMAFADVGRFEEAVKFLRAGLEKHPGYADGWENLAIALAGLNRLVEAAECLRQVLALQPARTGVCGRLAELESALALRTDA